MLVSLIRLSERKGVLQGELTDLCKIGVSECVCVEGGWWLRFGFFLVVFLFVM